MAPDVAVNKIWHAGGVAMAYKLQAIALVRAGHDTLMITSLIECIEHAAADVETATCFYNKTTKNFTDYCAHPNH
jgi:hypothetical protein